MLRNRKARGHSRCVKTTNRGGRPDTAPENLDMRGFRKTHALTALIQFKSVFLQEIAKKSLNQIVHAQIPLKESKFFFPLLFGLELREVCFRFLARGLILSVQKPPTTISRSMSLDEGIFNEPFGPLARFQCTIFSRHYSTFLAPKLSPKRFSRTELGASILRLRRYFCFSFLYFLCCACNHEL